MIIPEASGGQKYAAYAPRQVYRAAGDDISLDEVERTRENWYIAVAVAFDVSDVDLRWSRVPEESPSRSTLRQPRLFGQNRER